MAKYRGVAFAGFGGVGKSEATDEACAFLRAERVHVKDVLGECISPLLIRLGVPLDELRSYIYGHKKDHPLPLAPNVSAVTLLQAQGNGFLKECGEPMLAQRLAIDRVYPTVPIVNESLRFPREAEYIRSRGLAIVKIVRPGYTGKVTVSGQLHESELLADQIPYDALIQNAGTLQDLKELVREALVGLGFSKVVAYPSNLSRVVVLINGRPRSGKDDFCKFFAAHLEERHLIEAKSFSAIDPVRNMLTDYGVDVSKKTPEDQKLLADLGEMLEAHSDFKTKNTVEAASMHALSGLSFIHVREPHTIAKMRAMLAAHKTYTLWMSRPGYDAGPASNASDAIDQSQVEYDWSVVNSGSLDDLKFAAADFADRLAAGEVGGHINSEGMARWT